jgi:hypothetical protein
MAVNRETKKAKEFLDKIMQDYPVWSQRIPDTPYNQYAHKKPFDAIITFGGIAIEFKYKDGGKTFNLNGEWRDKEPHQEIGLRKFHDCGAGVAMLLIFWKRKNRIHIKWLPIEEIINEDKISFDDMYSRKEFEELVESVLHD